MSARRILPFRKQWAELGMDEIPMHHDRELVVNMLESIEFRMGYPKLADLAAKKAFEHHIMDYARGGLLPECVERRLRAPVVAETQLHVLKSLRALFAKYRPERARRLLKKGIPEIKGLEGTAEVQDVRERLLGCGIEGIPRLWQYNSATYVEVASQEEQEMAAQEELEVEDDKTPKFIAVAERETSHI